MIIKFFHPGMVIESYFLLPGQVPLRPRRKLCVVMSVHTKGLLVHPFIPRGGSAEQYAVYTKSGRVACDLRNIIETPTSYAIAQTMNSGVPSFTKALLTQPDFDAVREQSLDCAYNGLMKSERLNAKTAPMERRRSA